MEPASKTIIVNQPNWLLIKEFEAEASQVDKVICVVNKAIFCAALFGAAYTYTIGGSGLLIYGSYLAMTLTARKIVSVIIGYFANITPILSVIPRFKKTWGFESLKSKEEKQISKIAKKGFIAEKISLYKSGVKYAAIRITHKDTIENGNWTIHALGSGSPIEHMISHLAKKNLERNCNTLLINGPSIGSSEGWPTPYQMQAGFETGLRYLEETIKAKRIIMEGFSVGAGVISEAILKHDFSKGIKNNIKYLSISICTFSYLSTIAGALIGRWVLPIFYLLGVEFNCVAAAKKLSQLKISHIVIQHTSEKAIGTDGIIADKASLAYELHKDRSEKIYLECSSIKHSDILPEGIQKDLKTHIEQFLSN